MTLLAGRVRGGAAASMSVLMLLAAACGGGSAEPVAAPPVVAVAPYNPPPDPVPFEIRRIPDPNAPVAPQAATSAAQAGPSAAASPAGVSSGGARPAPAPAGGTAPAVTPVPGPAFVQGPGPKVPKFGRYTSSRSGTRTTNDGPPEKIENTATIDVTWQGEGSKILHVEQSPTSRIEIDYNFDAAGGYISRLKSESSRGAYEQRFNPPLRWVRWPLRVGDTWKDDWISGPMWGSSSVRVLREETIQTVGGPRKTFVLETTQTASGAIELRADGHVWYSPDLGIDVRRVTDSTSTLFGQTTKTHLDWRLTATP